jgi:hypothetical protein
LITKEQLAEVIADQEQNHRLLGTLLLEREWVSSMALKNVLNRQSSELIYEAIRWQDAWYSFQQGGVFTYSAELGLPIAGVVMEAFRRVDEWRQIEEAIDFDCILTRNEISIEGLGEDSLTQTEQRVLEAVDGHRCVREIVDVAHASSFEGCRILYQFLQSRLVRRRVA